MCIAVPEISIPVGHSVRFGMRFGYLDFVEMAAILWVEMEDGAMVRLNTPEIVADPCDAVGSVAGSRERMDYLETVFNVDLVDRGSGWHCYPEFIIPPF